MWVSFASEFSVPESVAIFLPWCNSCWRAAGFHSESAPQEGKNWEKLTQRCKPFVATDALKWKPHLPCILSSGKLVTHLIRFCCINYKWNKQFCHHGVQWIHHMLHVNTFVICLLFMCHWNPFALCCISYSPWVPESFQLYACWPLKRNDVVIVLFQPSFNNTCFLCQFHLLLQIVNSTENHNNN